MCTHTGNTSITEWMLGFIAAAADPCITNLCSKVVQHVPVLQDKALKAREVCCVCGLIRRKPGRALFEAIIVVRNNSVNLRQ